MFLKSKFYEYLLPTHNYPKIHPLPQVPSTQADSLWRRRQPILPARLPFRPPSTSDGGDTSRDAASRRDSSPTAPMREGVVAGFRSRRLAGLDARVALSTNCRVGGWGHLMRATPVGRGWRCAGNVTEGDGDGLVSEMWFWVGGVGLLCEELWFKFCLGWVILKKDFLSGIFLYN